MYRYSNGQISLADFKQPVGMNVQGVFAGRYPHELDRHVR